jgi:uncharacterized repeat protein (TIGR01451 family)
MSEDTTQPLPEDKNVPSPEDTTVPPPNAIDISQDKIHIVLPDKTRQSVAMKPTGLGVGRSPDNDIVLNQNGVSRHHVRIDFDGTTYLVQDLKSMNGTFIGKQQLTPETPAPWLPGEDLSIGDCTLLLERASQGQTTAAVVSPTTTQPSPKPSTASATVPTTTPLAQSTQPQTMPGIPKPIVRPDGSVIEDSQLVYSQARNFGAVATSPNITLTPGKPATISLILVNRGTTDDILRTEISGIPPEWMPGRIPAYNLPAGTQRDVQVTFQAPRTPESRAGRHSVKVRVTSQNTPNQVIELRITLTIAAYTRFVSELKTPQLEAGRIGQVVIHNQGNLPDTFSLALDDKGQELTFDPPQARITIPPGQAAAIEFRVTMVQPRLMGPEMSHPFGAIVSSQSGQYQPHSGEVISRGMVPSWAPVALILLCLMSICGIIIIFSVATAGERQARHATATYEAMMSERILGTAVAETKAAQNTQTAATQMVEAITATAAWYTNDTDQDGLSNSLEATLGTKPDDPDTDKDGLTDGEEYNKYKTNPLLQDSDGDGLTDGDEVKRGTNPLNRDTDGDGIPDNIDPDPLHGPTATPTFILTPTSTPTPTPTTTQVPSADLVVTVDNGTVSSVPGRTTTYTIVVWNKGPSSVPNIQVEDTFPDSLQTISWGCSATSGSNCQTGSGTGNILIAVNLTATGKATFIVNATNKPTASGLLSNSARARLPAGVTELNDSDNQSMDTDSLNPQLSFSLTITDNKTSVSPGDPISYIIMATNSGPSAASGVAITDYFPGSLTNMTWGCTTSAGSSCSPGGTNNGNVSVNANLLPGGSVTITANGNVSNSASGDIINMVSLVSPVDPAVNNRNASDTTTVVAKADLRVSASAPITASSGTTITYTISVANVGVTTATGVILTQVLPTGATFVSSTPGMPACQLSGNTLICNLGNLAAGATVDIKVAVTTPGAPGIMSTQIDVHQNEEEITPADNHTTIDILII